MRRTQAIALVALCGLLVIPLPAFTAAASTSGAPDAGAMIRLTSLAPRFPADDARLGRLSSQQRLAITIVFRPAHTDQLSALLHDLHNPTSPRYEHWLPTGAFVREFGPTPTEVATVTSWLHDQGLSDTSVQGMTVHARGEVADLGRALGVSFSHYPLASGATGYVASGAPLVPRTVADRISAVVGLSDTVRLDNALDVTPRAKLSRPARADSRATAPRSAPKACATARAFAGNNFWTPDQVGNFSRVNQLFDAGLTGRGKTIALFELGQSHASDTNMYFQCFGLHNRVTVKRVDGGANVDNGGTLEANLDIQQVATQAPGASILSYEAPNTPVGQFDAYNRIVTDNVAQVVSTSWGKCEAVLAARPGGPAFIDSLHTTFQQAAAQGQSVFAVTGDTGSEDCFDGTRTPPSETLQVDHPADDPFVTAVGGTSLEDPGVEPVWNDCEGSVDDTCATSGPGAGGGGQSKRFTRPSWQVLASNATCSTCRELPDIAANAGVGETFYNSGWTPVGGTSIAAPLLAGFAVDIAQGCKSARLGQFAPRLTALAARQVNGTAFADVNSGINWTNLAVVKPGTNDLTHTNGGSFRTTPGYDLATGFGVPLASGLACPQITSMTPNHGQAGTRVTLHGVGLERASIKFGTHTANVLSAGPTTAVVVAPPGSGTVDVSGSDPIGSGNRAALFSYPGIDGGLYRTAAADGTVFNFGGALGYGRPDPASLHAPIVGMALDSKTEGYWLASADGNVYNFNAPFLGSAGGHPLNQPIVGIAATKNGDGYWLVARDGGIFAFGKARFRGSTGGIHLNQPIVGITVAPKTGGYWLVASDGGIFAFHAPFFGSTGAIHLNQPIVGIAANNVTGGYWLVASDGGVFAFHAPFYGSTGAIHLNQPIVGIAATTDARGYRFVAADGGVFNFGDAKFSGSTGSGGLRTPVVAVTPAR